MRPTPLNLPSTVERDESIRFLRRKAFDAVYECERPVTSLKQERCQQRKAAYFIADRRRNAAPAP
jgi:hypothetical protein